MWLCGLDRLSVELNQSLEWDLALSEAKPCSMASHLGDHDLVPYHVDCVVPDMQQRLVQITKSSSCQFGLVVPLLVALDQ